MDEAVLKVDSIGVGYGQSRVIEGLSVSARSAEIVALLGLNGMGKTTLMKALIGLLPVRGGAIRLGTEELTGRSPHERVAAGLGYVPQGRLVFPTLTVEENVEAGLVRGERRAPPELFHFFPILKEMRRRRAGNLSGGQQQQLAIARALASRPKVLLLDEPTEGIQPSIIKELAVVLKRIRDERGLTILVTEQMLSFALDVADRVVVLSRGRIIHEAPRAGLDERALGKMLSI